MAKASKQPLQPNPFRTYRDPQTGLWVVIQAPTVMTNQTEDEDKPNHLDSTPPSSVSSILI